MSAATTVTPPTIVSWQPAGESARRKAASFSICTCGVALLLRRWLPWLC
jgi:hypothetical protein